MENNWIETKYRTPKFGQSVFVYCRIWGRYIANFAEIDDSGCGEWRDWNDKIVLPPTQWMHLPEIPKANI